MAKRRRGRTTRKAQRRERAGGESIQAILASGLSNLDAARKLNQQNHYRPAGRIRRFFPDIDIARLRSRLGQGE